MSSSKDFNRSGPSSRRSTKHAQEQGYALLAVVGAMAVLSVIAVSLSQRAQLGVSGATALLEETRDQYAIEAGVTLAIRTLFEQPKLDDHGQLRLDLAVDGRHLSIIVIEESRKTDVNRASMADLTKLFVRLGLDSTAADSLSQRVIDWRDLDDRRQQYGAEGRDYLSAGILAIPRNMPFVSLDEVETVLGMPIDVASRLHEELTFTPGFAKLTVSPAPAIASLAPSSATYDLSGGVSTTSDGITRHADETASSNAFSVQIVLERGIGRTNWDHLRYLVSSRG